MYSHQKAMFWSKKQEIPLVSQEYESILKKLVEMDHRVTTIEMFHEKYKAKVRRSLQEIAKLDEETKDLSTGMLIPV